MRINKLFLAVGLTSILLTGCNGSSKQPNVEEPQLVNPAWLSTAKVQMDFIEQSFDLNWNAYGYYSNNAYGSNVEAAPSLLFEYGPTPTNHSLTPVQWNLTWLSGVNGAAYASPYILYKLENLTPGETYFPTAMVEVESKTSLESFTGGSGPEFVIGAFSSAPQRVEEQGTGLYILEIDQRTLNRSADTVSLGFVDIPEQFLQDEYLIKRITNNPSSISAVANADGELWVLLAVYSGHVGANTVHLKKLAIDW